MIQSRVAKPESQPLSKDMADLATAIASLSAADRDKIEPIYQRVVESTKQRQRILALVQEALGQLRLDMKYLLFDLEATRREREEFRRCLEGEDE